MINYKLHKKPQSLIQERYISLAISFSFETNNIKKIWKNLVTIILTTNENKDFTLTLKIIDNKATLKYNRVCNELLFEMEEINN